MQLKSLRAVDKTSALSLFSDLTVLFKCSIKYLFLSLLKCRKSMQPAFFYAQEV